ncbi:carboxypeptidase-like regulatory domain-containing protein [Rhodohalobacter sp. 614A]|uniref:carboxypeptidase-like regulatory domain-containing protein n=1 Tax=Rhodohalobacter sp. 614A TaxID=2908649 RepID=UPI001F2070F3|nr:carboxypeptidase-like regulatory domain-containing protein [Rhodohalobacter sp. 614A]
MHKEISHRMTHFIKWFLFLLLTIYVNQGVLHAQSQVQATVTGISQILPSPYISDFEQNIRSGNYQVHLNVTGTSSVQVRFHVRLTLDSEVLVDEISLPGTFDSGFHVLSPFPNFVEFESTTREILEDLPGNRFRQAFQTGSFPEGNYTVTVEPQIVGSQMPGIPGMANFMVRYPQPPTLINPTNGASVSEAIITPVFNWSPVMGPPGLTLEYEFLLVELFDDQNPADAILSNREHASALSVGNTTLPYAGGYLPLEEGKTYAWQVTARDVNGEIPIKNEGRSEIHVFTFGSEQDEEEQGLIANVPEMTFTPVESLITVTTISGRVNWRFRPTEGFEQMQPSDFRDMINLTATNDSNVQVAIDDPNYSLENANYNGQIYTGFANQIGGEQSDESDQQRLTDLAVPVYGGGITGNIQVQNFGQSIDEYQNQFADITEQLQTHPMSGAEVKAVVNIDGTPHVIASTKADENGNYTLSFAPSELDRLINQPEESESSGSPLSNFTQQTQIQTVNIQNIDSPVYQASDLKPAIHSIQIVVDSPYFTFSEEKFLTVSTLSAKTYNAGIMTATALTYRMYPTVVDHEDEERVANATIEIFRPLAWYDVAPALKPEGWPLDAGDEGSRQIINGSTVLKVAETNASGIITQLFPRKKGTADRYVVRVSAEGFNPLVTTLSASPQLSVTESVTVEKTYKLTKAPPTITGRVVRRDNQAPIRNAVVALEPPSGNDSRIAMTNREGRFTIAAASVLEEPYKLTVTSSRTAKYEEELLLNESGVTIERDPLIVDPTLISVVGKVVNDEGISVSNATVKWEDGGNPVQTDQYGRFVTANTAGTHVLQIRKMGHADVDTSITIEVSDEDSWGDLIRESIDTDWNQETAVNFAQNTGQWANSLVNTESFQIDIDNEDQEEEQLLPFEAMGYNGNMYQSYNVNNTQTLEIVNQNNLNISPQQFENASSYFMDLMGESGSPGDVQDVGTIIISRSVGKLDVTVEAISDSSPIEGANVEVGSGGLNANTDAEGNIYFDEAPSGTVPVKVVAPGSTNFVTVSTEVTITDNGDVTTVTIPMEIGGRATGTVTANGNPVENATIRLEGREDISTTSADDGTYTLPGIPTGEWTLKVSKSGFVGASETATFAEDDEQTIDFSLQDSEFNIASLLGFEIEVDELSTESDTTISGAFVSIQSNDLLSVDSRLRIPFSDVQVYEDNGILKPIGGEVQTDASEITAKIFDYLHVTISNQQGLVVRSRQIPSDIGYLAGKVEVDYESTFTSATGWEWPNAADQFLELPNTDDLPEGIGEDELVTLTSDGSFPFPDIGVPDFELRFGSASETIELYGFDVTLNLNESVLKNDGFHMNGDITLAGIPLLDTATLSLQKFWIGTDGTVREATLDLDPKPELELANWAMELASGGLSETGFSFGGSVELSVPGSDPTEITFSDLSISPDQIFGGQFSLPSTGIDVYGIVQLQSKPGTDISFGKVQNEDVYYITGAAKIDLPKYIDESLVFREFLVRTDGQFSANIAADFEADFFGLADLTVNGVTFENIGRPSIYVDGQFGLRAIPFITAQAGGITYEPGGDVSLDKIDLDFDVGGVASVGAGIGFVDTAQRTGFSGSGNFGISGTPLDLEIDFFYEQVNSGGISFGVDVNTGLPPIQLGTVALSGIGGGFKYTTSNTEMEITLRGVISVAPGAEHAIALDPLQVTVEAGNGAPVITGLAQVAIMSQQIADAKLTIDFGKPFFDLEVNIGFEKLQDVNITVDGSSRLVLSGEQGDQYWFVGARYDASLFDLFNANADILAAWNLDVSSHPEYQEYTSFVSSDYVTGGEINGIHLDVATEFGIPKKDKKCAGFLVGEACGWFHNSTRCQLNADFGGGNYGFFLGSDWSGGGNVDFLGFDVIGADVSASGSVSGSYINNVWRANGRASAKVSGYIGDCKVGCQTKFCWPSCGLFDCPIPKGASLCVSGSIEVDYRSNRGLQVSLDL